MNVVIYARFSSHSQTEQSIEGQLKVCYEYAESNHYTVVGEYIDRAISGTTDNRAEFQRMISDSDRHTFEGVLVYQLDRFARNRYDSAINKAKLKKNGVRVLSAKENIADDASGILVEGVLESMAEYYSVELSQKIHRGMAINAEKCLSNGSNPGLGFKVDAERRFYVDEEEAAIVREIYERYASGETKAEIIRDLKRRRVKTSLGKEFSPNSLSHLLSNKRYIGVYLYKGKETPGGMPRILDDDLFYRVQSMMNKNKNAPARTHGEGEYLLTTKLFCGHCKEMMVGYGGTSKTGRQYHYYMCKNVRRKKCAKKIVSKSYIEDRVVNECLKMLTEEKIRFIAKKVAEECAKSPDNLTAKALKKAIQEADTAIENLWKAIEQGQAVEMLTERLNKRIAEKAELEAQLAIEENKKITLTEAQILAFLDYVCEMPADDVNKRRAIINIFVHSIYLYDDHFTLIINASKKPLSIDNITLDDIETAFESETGASEGCSSLSTPAPTEGNNRAAFMLDTGLGISKATLNLTDCGSTVHRFTPDTNGLWVRNETDGTKSITGGVITGGTGLLAENVRYGGAIYIYGNNTVNIYGGNLVGNMATQMGGAVYMNGNESSVPVLNICGGGFYGNVSSVDGGAIGARIAAVIVDHARFEANKANTSGGAIYTLSGYASSDTTYINNVAKGSGAVWTKGTATVTNDTYRGNSATGDGAGAIYVDDGTLHIDSSTFTGNTATYHGGAIYARSGMVNINNSHLEGNESTGGDAGAVYVVNSGTTLISNNTTYTENKAKKSGGAIFALTNATVTIEGGTFSQNKTTDPTNDGNGGAIGAWTGTNLTVKNATFTENEGLWGGAIRTNSANSVTIEDSTFTGNKAVNNVTGTTNRTGYGGAIRTSGTSNAVITGSTFTGNQAWRSGGAIFAESPMTLTGSEIMGNAAGIDAGAADGGGLRLIGEYTVTIKDTIIENNTTTSGGRGGGVFAWGEAAEDGTVKGCTLALAGKIIVDGNTLNGAANNIFLADGATITIGEGGLAADSSIGYTLPSYTDGATIVSSGAQADDVLRFFADVTGREAAGWYEEHQNGTLILKNHTEHTYENGICTLCKCGHTPHSYENGTCTVCGYEHAPHTCENNVCTVCGVVIQQHPICGMTCTHEGEASHESIVFLPIPAGFTGGVLSGNYYLDRDITLTTEITVAEDTTLNLCLSGRVLTAPAGSRAITVNGGELNLTDCGNTEHKFRVEESGLWVLDDNGTETVTGGVITGGNGEGYSGGIFGNATASTFGKIKIRMYGGHIVGNTAIDGGGIAYAGAAPFEMYGGSIVGNTGEMGGGINASTAGVTMYGGRIANNHATADGGGIYGMVMAQYRIFGGEISDNAAVRSGGGVFVPSKGEIYVGGSPVIRDNTAGGVTNNVYLADGLPRITIADGGLTDGAYLGISGEGVFANACDINCAAYFTSDNGHAIVYTADKTLAARAGDVHSHPLCGSSDGSDGSCGCVGGHGNMEFLPLPENFTGGELAGNYYLDRDITLTGPLVVAVNTTLSLCLNGHVLTAPANSRAITVNGGELNLTDCTQAVHKFTPNTDGLWVIDEQNGTETVTGGVITGGNVVSGSGEEVYGGAIYAECPLVTVDDYMVRYESVIRMYGGNLVGNTANTGGGVYSEGSSGRNNSFALYGGSIAGNKASYGGGVYALDTLMTMHGGRIVHNQATGYGGGIYTADGTLALCGGEISGNTAEVGGGICAADGALALCDGEISDNTAQAGGGAYAQDTDIQVSGAPVIRGNRRSGEPDDRENNLEGYDDSTRLTIAEGGLTAGASIGIWGEGEFANPCDTDYSAYFTSDNGYTVMYTRTKTLAAYGTQTHPLCGESCSHSPAHEDVTFEPLPATFSGGNLSGNYYLAEDVTLSSTIMVPEGQTLNLCLNGKVLTAPTGQGAITVRGTLTLTDCTQAVHKFTPNSNGRWVRDEENGTKSVSGGVITGSGGDCDCGGIYIEYGSMTMYGGNITGNEGFRAGGVYLDHGSMTMYGGQISGNRAYGSGGGGVSSRGGSITMYGGQITGNMSSSYGGGGVYATKDFVMHGGQITGNTAVYGGGVCLEGDGNMQMHGGQITGNTVRGNGGGICVCDGTGFTMYAGEITGNAAGSTGGGVAVQSSGVSLHGGRITDNTRNGAANNIQLMNDNWRINLGENMAEGSAFGISGEGVFTAPCNTDHSSRFTSDTDGGAIVYLEDQTLVVYAHYHPLCGESCTHGGEHESQAWQALTASFTGGTLSGSWYLAEDVTLTSAVTVPAGQTLNLCLNGKVLKQTTAGPVIEVSGTMNLCDCGEETHIFMSGTTPWTLAADGTTTGTTTVAGGVIMGGRYSSTGNKGGGVYVTGTLNMYGGNIVGNSSSSDNGGGVRVVGGTFNLHDGCIAGNTATHGGGVDVSVTGNTTGIFNMTGGTITGNNSADGGGVRLHADAQMTMTGGSISDNVAVNYGGGICMALRTEITLTGGKVTGNIRNKNGKTKTNNIELFDGAKIILGDTMARDASFGIYGGGVVAKACNTDYSAHFTSDNGYDIRYLPDRTLFAGQYHPLCGETCSHGETHEMVAFTPLTADFTGGELAGSYYLAENINLTKRIIVPKDGTLNLCLNGNILRQTATDGNVDNVILANGSLNLCDCSEKTHRFDASGACWQLNEENGAETITGGAIVGGKAQYGGGVTVGNYGNNSFNMYGGNIVGNEGWHGGGVYVGNGFFNLYGGNIVGNNAKEVASSSSSTTGCGGGVYLYRGTFAMSGGTIANNTALTGGAVYLELHADSEILGEMIMNGGTITGNTAARNAGGVYADGTGIMLTGGTVTGNRLSDGKASNINLGTGKMITLGDTMAEGSSFGIYGTGVFAEPCNNDYSAYFISDHGRGYTAVYMEDKTLSIFAHYHPLCGAGCTHDGAHTTIADWQPLPDNFTGGELYGNYYLAEDVTLTTSITIPSGQTLNLCLNGYVLTAPKENRAFVVNGTLNLCDCGTEVHKFTTNIDGLWVLNEENGTKTIIGGVITGGSGGVTVNSTGTFNLYGGSIVGNTVQNDGGGVYLNGGSFTMYGGSITGNTASGAGGGVYPGSGTMTLHGGSITGNTANNANNNIMPEDGVVITLGDTLAEDSVFGIYGEGVFTNACDTDHSARFTSDNGYTIVYLPNNTLMACAHYHPMCGESCTHSGEHGNEAWLPWPDDFTGDELSGSYYLTDNVDLTSLITVPDGQTLNLCLNGKVLRQTATTPDCVMDVYGTLNLTDCGEEAHKFSINGQIWTLDETGGTETVNGGVITGGDRTYGADNSKSYGGGVYVRSGAAFHMYGGHIVGNKSNYGGGVYVSDGTFTLHGGSIQGNNTYDDGGGVGISAYSGYNASFIMEGGQISHNIVGDGDGGGVWLSGSGTGFTMNGGEIAENKAFGTPVCYGGGVHVNNGSTFTLHGGSIRANECGYGGGVSVYSGTFRLKGGSITDNATRGEGVNQTIYNGGGVYVKENGSFIVSGAPVVQNNTNNKTVAAENVWLVSGKTITIGEGGLTTGAQIGIYGEGVFAAACDTDSSAYFTSDNGLNIYHLTDKTLAAYAHYHSLCGKSCTHEVAHAATNEWQPLTETFTGGTLASGNYYLDADITLTAPITFASDAVVNICLNGHVLNGGSSGSIFKMDSATNVTLNITDCGKAVHKFTLGDSGLWVPDEEGGTETVTGGVITGGTGTASGSTTYGGVFFLFDATNTVNFYGGNVVGNTANRGGVLWMNTGASFNVYGGNFQGNTASQDGGAFNVDDGTLTIGTGVTICDNVAGGNGGAVNLRVGTVTVTGAVLERNESTGGDAGAIYVGNADAALISNNTNYTENKAKKSGGAIFALTGATVTIDGGTFTQNKTTDPANDGNGGAIGVWNDTKLTIKNATFTENEGLWGGAVRTNNASAVTIEKSTFTGNKAVKYTAATGYGGAIRTAGTSNAAITDCTFIENTAARSGGMIYAESPVTISNTTIRGNAAGLDGSAADGGGLALKGSYAFSLDNVTIQSNSTTTGGRGGGVFVEKGTLTLGGKVVIDGNTLASEANNLHFLNEARVNIAEGGLAESSCIGYTLQNYTDGTVIVSSGAAAKDAAIFFADATDKGTAGWYEVYQDGKLILRNHSQHTYENGVCTLCGYVHAPHTFGEDNVCTACGIIRQYHPLCGADCTCGGGHENMEFLPIPASFTGGALSGSYYLTGDLALTSPIAVPAGRALTLCLSGHTLTAPANNRAITANGILNLTDCGNTAHKFRATTEVIDEYFTAEYWVLDETGGTETITGGMIIGGTVTEFQGMGGCICVNGTMNMYGGILTGGNLTKSGYGGGVYLEYSGTMNMYGGSIVGNKSSHTGGGIYFAGSFTMYGGSITGNYAGQYGGGVGAFSGTFTMYGGTISGNCAKIYGGGVYVDPGEGTSVFTMNGGSITGNKAQAGGGVLNYSNFIMNGGIITGNTVTGQIGYGGVRQTGGGVLSGGSSFILSGNAVVTDNYYVEGESAPKPNNIYLSYGLITLGTLTKGASFGILGEGVFTESCETDYSAYFTSDSGCTIQYVDKVLVAYVTQAHPLCGETCSHDGGHENITFTVIPEDFTGGTLSGNYFLHEDLALSSPIEVLEGETLNLCLSGHVLTAPSENRAITVNGTLNLTDCSTDAHKFTPNSEGLWVLDDTSGTEMVTGGVITGGNATYGGGIYVDIGGSMTMYGGSLSGNYAGDRGGGAYVVGSMTMHGGSLSGNYAGDRGGGAYVVGSMTMHDGSLSGNHAGAWGGGIMVGYEWNNSEINSLYGTLTMHGGRISENSADQNGGVYVSDYCSFVMSGGEITDNAATLESYYDAGGVYVNGSGSFTVSGASKITGNRAAYLGRESNLFSNSRIHIGEGGLTKGAAIGMDGYQCGVFSENCNTDYSRYFTSDIGGVILYNETDKTLEVYAQIHPACGEVCTHGGEHEEIKYQAIRGLSAMSLGGNFCLIDDIVIYNTITIPEGKTVNLCLNGHVIRLEEYIDEYYEEYYEEPQPFIKRVFNVNGTLNLCDCSTTRQHHFTPNEEGLWVLDETSGTKTVTGGVITGGRFDTYDYSISDGAGAGVRIGGSGVLNMYGGNIVGNKGTQYGGGVYVDRGGIFRMYGGSIAGNTAWQGGAVYLRGATFDMHGGLITGNRTTQGYGNVSVQDSSYDDKSVFTMTGGRIAGNMSDDSYCGGVCLVGSELILAGNPVIEENRAGGGSFVCNVKLDGGKCITIGKGGLTEGARVGITTNPAPTAGNAICFTAGAAESQYFFSDNATYVIRDGEDGKLYLALPMEVELIITWSSMDFTYTEGTWNSRTHAYEGAGWQAAEGGSAIIVRNVGTSALDVTFAFTANSENNATAALSGSFTQEGGEALTAALPVDPEETKNVLFAPTGKPGGALANERLGNISITVAAAQAGTPTAGGE